MKNVTLQLTKLTFLFLFVSSVLACNKESDYSQRTSYFHNSSTSYSADSVITCVTYNIHLGFTEFDDPWDKETTSADMAQVKNIATILRSVNPDIVALQEVPRNRYNANVKNFLEALAAELNMNFAFGAHGYNDPYDIYPVHGEWGNAI